MFDAITTGLGVGAIVDLLADLVRDASSDITPADWHYSVVEVTLSSVACAALRSTDDWLATTRTAAGAAGIALLVRRTSILLRDASADHESSVLARGRPHLSR